MHMNYAICLRNTCFLLALYNKKPSMRLLVLFLSILCVTSYAQTDCPALADAVPKGKQFYMIGEVHLGQEIPIRENVRMITKATVAEDSIRRYLSGTCGVNHYMLELPNSYGYFIREYMQSGDTSWIHFISTDTYWYERIKHLYALKKIQPDLRVSCVDVNYPQYAERTIFALLTLTFYDHYWKFYYPPYNTTTAQPVSADLNLALAIMQADTVNITAPLRALFIEYIKLLATEHSNSEKLYTLINSTMQNKSLMLAMEKYYTTGWPEVLLIMRSYLAGYKYPDINTEMIGARDTLIFGFVKELIDHSEGDIFCLQLGDMHTRGLSKTGDVSDLIYAQYGFQPFVLHLVPETFAYRLQQIYHPEKPYQYNFISPWCLQPIKEGEVEVLIKNQ